MLSRIARTTGGEEHLAERDLKLSDVEGGRRSCDSRRGIREDALGTSHVSFRKSKPCFRSRCDAISTRVILQDRRLGETNV